MKRACVVIGGGISGMSAALLLARQGFAVQLVDKSPRLAPLVRGFRRKGIHFDTGFHHTGYLERGEVLDRAFRLMGISDLETFPLGQQGDQRVVIDGGPEEGYPMPSGFDRALEMLGNLFPRERHGLAHYLKAVRSAQDSSPYLNPHWNGQDEWNGSGPILSEVLDSLFQDIRLKALLASQTLYHGVPAAEAPFVFHARVGAAALRSLCAVRGGGEALVKAFENALRQADVQVLTGSGATGIAVSPAGAVSGVHLDDGRLIEADTCVSTVHPALLAGLVPDGVFRPAYLNRLANLPESPRASMVFGMLPEGGHEAPGNSWLFLDGLDAGAWFQESLPGRPGGMSVMISPSSSSDGPAGLEIAVCDSLPGRSKQERIEGFTRFFKEKMPAMALGAVFLDAAVPSTFARYANSPYGSYYGPKHAAGSYPPQPRTRLPGLFLAGQAVVAPGVAGAVISACVAVDVLLGTSAVLKELRQC